MPRQARLRRAVRNTIPDADVQPFIRAASEHVGPFYAVYNAEFRPLADFTVIPDELETVALPNGDLVLHTAGGVEPSFDVVAVVAGSYLEAPPGFPKSNFPFFRRWIRVSAHEEPFFDASLTATDVLFKFMATHYPTARPPPVFCVNGSKCLRPSALMLTSLEVVPDAIPVDIPPLENLEAFEAAMAAGQGRFIFSSDNEVLFFKDEMLPNGDIGRQEVGPDSIQVGQIVRLNMQFRLMKQDDGSYTFRQVLKGAFILDDGMSKNIARALASRSSGIGQKRSREIKSYTVGRGDGRTANEMVETARMSFGSL